MNLSTPDHPTTNIPVIDVVNAVSVDYDPEEHHVYWLDDDKRTISRAKLDGTG